MNGYEGTEKLQALEDGTTYFQMVKKVREARLHSLDKHLLNFYVGVYNWSDNTPSFYEEERVAAYTGMSVSTVHKKRKNLEKLGWISVVGGGFKKTPFIFVHVGENDPTFESKCYSVWEPENKALSNSELAKLTPEEITKYQERRKARRRRSDKVRNTLIA